ncbi:MAG: hypothetical protein PHY54_15550 [Methylococcales bacterium]|nr:hypothetical protein [Methylococcales bacterium]
MSQIVIGVDIAKKKFDVASLCDGKYKHKAFANNEQGFANFVSWLLTHFSNDKPLVCMEATRAYSILHDQPRLSCQCR